MVIEDCAYDRASFRPRPRGVETDYESAHDGVAAASGRGYPIAKSLQPKVVLQQRVTRDEGALFVVVFGQSRIGKATSLCAASLGHAAQHSFPVTLGLDHRRIGDLKCSHPRSGPQDRGFITLSVVASGCSYWTYLVRLRWRISNPKVAGRRFGAGWSLCS
jgi:hypothetical protein